MTRAPLLALVVLAVVAAAHAAPPPHATITHTGAVTVTLPLSVLQSAEVKKHLTSGLTTAFVITVVNGRNEGGARLTVRYELWEEKYFVSVFDAAGRKMPVEKLREVAKGRVWTGEDAKERGLVDELGGFPVALKLAKEAAKVEGAVRVEVFPRKKGTAEVLAELLGEKKGENSDDEEAGVEVSAPWSPVLKQTRALYQLGVKLGMVEERRQMLSAPVPDTTW